MEEVVMSKPRLVGLILGPILFIIMLLVPPPQGMDLPAWRIAASTVLMAIWWITEAIPIPATALLPILLYPVLGVFPISQVTAAYGNHIIYLFIGGFFMAVSMEHWGLHRRIALKLIKKIGMSPDLIILAFMLATWFLSMWISNTATTLMMVPITISILKEIVILQPQNIEQKGYEKQSSFAIALLLGIAYSASIGGIATLIGTPPNTVMAGLMSKMFQVEINFAQWMLFAFPLSLMLLFVAWFFLTKVLYKSKGYSLNIGSFIDEEIKKLAKMNQGEKNTLVVLSIAVILWLTRGFFKYIPNEAFVYSTRYINDSVVAIAGALALFIIPVNLKKGEFTLSWETAVKIPWGIVLLFGGGFALAQGFSKTGLALWIASNLSALDTIPVFLFIFTMVLLLNFLTEITSNTATATMMIPILAATAIAMNIHPFILIFTGTVSTSFAFMLPIATPPNAIVFGSHYLQIKHMVRSGIWLNVISTILLSIFAYYLLPLIFNFDINVPPDWVRFFAEYSKT